MDDFKNCPKAYYAKKVIKIIPYVQGEEAKWGEWVHKQFENCQKFNTPLPPELSEHQSYMDSIRSSSGTHSTERRIALNRKLQPCGYFDGDVWYRGQIDFSTIDRSNAHIIDYKTGKVKNDWRQLKIFAAYVFAENPEVTRVNASYYWTQTRKADGISIPRSDVKQIWAELLPDLKQYVQAFKDDIWQPRPSGLCKGWCPLESCEHWSKKRIK